MSDISQSYDPKALEYLKANASVINHVAKQLNIPADAIAASMAREITRTAKKSFASSLLHSLSKHLAKQALESTLDREYAADKQKLKTDPGVFDGSYGAFHQIGNHTLADIGPGSIKVLTAFQLLEQYGQTSQGKQLGLDQYRLNDLRSIVSDLANPDSPLSIKIAALTILNGQNFFKGKKISGIPWDELSNEQKTAALTAYYTIGQRAVTTDMKENKFFPFGDGQVGGWVTYGQNFKTLNSILSNRKAPAISVVPKPVRKKAARQSASAFPRTEIGDFHAALMNAANTSVAIRINRDTKEFLQSLRASARTRPSHGVADILADARKSGKWLATLSGGGATVPSILAARRQAGEDRNATGAVAPFHMPPILSARHRTLPSVAPTRKFDSRHVTSSGREGTNSEYRGVITKDNVSKSAASMADHPQIDQWQFREMLSRELDDQARLPPSGATGFDPRLSPAWPGMKLPN